MTNEEQQLKQIEQMAECQSKGGGWWKDMHAVALGVLSISAFVGIGKIKGDSSFMALSLISGLCQNAT